MPLTADDIRKMAEILRKEGNCGPVYVPVHPDSDMGIRISTGKWPKERE